MPTSQRTLSIIKPDAVAKGLAGAILAMIQKNGFRIIGMKMMRITKEQASMLCGVHATRLFFDSLITFMSSGPIVILVLEKNDAIADLRKLIGATDPAIAEDGTIRKMWGESRQRNVIHGSDGQDSARFELTYLFARYELASTKRV